MPLYSAQYPTSFCTTLLNTTYKPFANINLVAYYTILRGCNLLPPPSILPCPYPNCHVTRGCTAGGCFGGSYGTDQVRAKQGTSCQEGEAYIVSALTSKI